MKRKRRKQPPPVQHVEQDYNGLFRKKKNKADWAGIHVGYAFSSNVDYYVRIPAQRQFYRAVRRIQIAAARQAGATELDTFQPVVSPQLAPFYTSYPCVPAAYAAIGITGFLEFQERVSETLLLTFLKDYLSDPAAADRVKTDPDIYLRVAGIVARDVQTRLLLEDLSRNPAMNAVEIYRLFSACQQSMRFRTVQEMIHCVILYGDLLPHWESEKLHPLTRAILTDLTDVSGPYFDQMSKAWGMDLVKAGVSWVRAVCRKMTKYLPVNTQASTDPLACDSSEFPKVFSKWFDRMVQKPENEETNQRFRPLDEPEPPSLFETPTIDQSLSKQLNGVESLAQLPVDNPPSESAKYIQSTLDRFAEMLQQACGQQSEYEDMRSDLVEYALRDMPFSETPITGTPSEGHEIEVRLGNERAESGEIFDTTVELSEDILAWENILSESQSVTEALRRSLYPNVEEIPERQRFRSSGMLDSSRLAMALFSGSVFQRYRIHEKADRRGRPVLLLACDGSGSLNRAQMKMTRILASAWLRSTARSNMQVLAGLYHSGAVRQGVTGPLVRWIYHPRKTPSSNKMDAVRAVVSLPDTGTGVQSDVISIAYMLNEARKLAKHRMIYMILITDCEWNRCFQNSKSGEDEMISFFENLYIDSQSNLHTTIVALGGSGVGKIESLVDKVIRVPDDKLHDCIGVAGEIGTYVAECIRERRRILK